MGLADAAASAATALNAAADALERINGAEIGLTIRLTGGIADRALADALRNRRMPETERELDKRRR